MKITSITISSGSASQDVCVHKYANVKEIKTSHMKQEEAESEISSKLVRYQTEISLFLEFIMWGANNFATMKKLSLLRKFKS